MTQQVPDSMIAAPLLAAFNPTDITASRALTAADFGFDVIRINAAGVVAVTVPTVAAMALAATAGKLRALIFEVLGGGIPTFAGATSSTSINNTAGPSTALPGSNAGSGGAAPITGGFYVLVQKSVGSDNWTLQ